MTSPADICNLALDAMSSKAQISGINPPVPPQALAAQVASRSYQIQVDSVLCAANWNDGRVEEDLEMVAAAQGTPENPDGTALPVPPFPWRYAYAYPTDCLRLRFVMTPPQSPDSAVPIMTNAVVNPVNAYPVTSSPFVVGLMKDTNKNRVKVVMSNVQNAIGVYTARIEDPDLWSPLLKSAIIAALAAWFVNPIARNKDMQAEKTAMAANLIQSARVADANEGVTSTDHLPDFLAIRGIGGGMFGGAEGSISGAAGLAAPWDAWIGPDGISY